MKKFKDKLKIRIYDWGATILGLLTSVATALGLLDIDTLDFKDFKTYVKLFVIVIPAIGGYVSQIKKKDNVK